VFYRIECRCRKSGAIKLALLNLIEYNSPLRGICTRIFEEVVQEDLSKSSEGFTEKKAVETNVVEFQPFALVECAIQSG